MIFGWGKQKVEQDEILVHSREKFTPIHLLPGDSLEVIWKDENGVQLSKQKVNTDVRRTYDEAVLIETHLEGRHAWGGLIVEQEK